MDETHTIDEALPTAGADDDQAASPGPNATGPTPPTQFRRAARRPLPTAIKQMGCTEGHARCTERVRELIAADPPDEHFIQALWSMRAMGQLTDEVRSRNPTLVQAWDVAEANPPPPQLQAMLAALAAQHLNAAEAA